jgi:glycosyltransferase involved in cell wall biosynthesis
MARDLNVLHVAQPTEAGVARIVWDLVADQVGRGFRVGVACPSSGRLAAAVRAGGAEHHEWRASRSPGPAVLGEAERLRRIVDDVKPDLVHLHSAKAGLAGRLALRGRLPTIFEPQAWSFWVGGLVGAAALRWERLGGRWSDATVCACEDERLAGEEAGIRSRFVVIPNGIDVSAFPLATEDDRREARARLGLPDGPLVVCVGRLSRQKGQDVLLDAWPAVAGRIPGSRLVLVGDGPDREALAERAEEGVELAGHRDDVATWLAAADVVALPSRWEVMVHAMLEAMARGRSVVVSDVAGSREAMGDSAGAVVPPEDPAALAEAIVERLRDPARAAAEGRAGHLAAVERHDFRRVAETTAELYADVLERRASAASS